MIGSISYHKAHNKKKDDKDDTDAEGSETKSIPVVVSKPSSVIVSESCHEACSKNKDNNVIADDEDIENK